MKNLGSACTTATAPAVCHEAGNSWSTLFSRLFSRKRTYIVITEHSPEYLLRDIGIGDGRTQYYSRDGHKLPEWR
ncbi:hypothetical protein HED50_17925 [Ochrobactrum oryzae]|uniref:Uncharacterized protein n=1 Tax=Brucella oryzae TaxID=335286 RepID=A0A2S7IWL9_9HYPH|nr:hypothetical protein [Brucella oryzae]MBR7653821.1 hypothetical protein [Brucella oryzae]NKC23020.1 hypothetical protein [Brucella oryzae]PQA72409.1 hypothetical protein C3731_16895 [Brucella oryzae]